MGFMESTAVFYSLFLSFGFLGLVYFILILFKLFLEIFFQVNCVFAFLTYEWFRKSLVYFIQNFLFLLWFWALHWFHFSLNGFLNKLKLLFFTIELDPDGKWSSLFCGEKTPFPHTKNCVHSEFILEKRYIHRSWEFLVDSGFD